MRNCNKVDKTLISEAVKYFSRDPLVLNKLGLEQVNFNLKEISSGHIHQSYMIDDVIFLQKFNEAVFPNVKVVTDNTLKICDRLSGSQYPYQVSRPLQGIDGNYVYKNQFCWRAFQAIPKTYSINSADQNWQVFEAAKAFAVFQKNLVGLAGIKDPIEGFMDNQRRFKSFTEAVRQASVPLVESCRQQIDQIIANKDYFNFIQSQRNNHNNPIRPTHGDMKINNVLFNNGQNAVSAIIDLDTCMEGDYLFDYGDFLRIACATCVEDEKDESKINLNPDFYYQAKEGFKSGYESALSKELWDELPSAAAELCLTVASRFLADYLNGNKYFKVQYPEHNLDRAKNQLLLFEMWKVFR